MNLAKNQRGQDGNARRRVKQVDKASEGFQKLFAGFRNDNRTGRGRLLRDDSRGFGNQPGDDTPVKSDGQGKKWRL